MTDLFDDLRPADAAGVDADRLRAQHAALSEAYDVERWVLPLPVWATRGYDHDGEQAWETLRSDLSHSWTARPLCLYLHVPFCSRKCHFCDCYSFRLSAEREDEKQRYVRRLDQELRLWSEQGGLAERPVTTVHLGGGTPTHLGPALLGELVGAVRARFAAAETTQWALESTVEGLSPEMVEAMGVLGFTRLHIGVQTLADPVRGLIGRRNPAREVLDAIGVALGLGWTVSVDLVCGLPHQSLDSFVGDISTLVAAGVDGFSLYELLIYPQNRAWAERMGLGGRSHLPNYLMYQAGAALLEAGGFAKNTFNHWANQRDDNRYFTFPTRDEDCLAIGTIADGVLGDYHFRHPRYAPYLRSPVGTPGLEGGLRRTSLETHLHGLTTAVLSGHVSSSLAATLDDNPAGLRLSQRWVRHGLVRAEPDGGLTLLGNGSWFAGNMVGEMAAAHGWIAGRT